MLAETLSATFMKQIPPVQNLPIELGYFRSKLFITDAFTNPLVAAASPLISLLERINIATQLPLIEELQADISHEFMAFYSRLQRLHYSQEFFSIANYLLCATIDELLGKNYLRLHGDIQSFKAFTPITLDNINPQEHFFNILNQLLTDPEQCLDLIELSYYCLLIGYEGKYHLDNNGRATLDNLIETLFQTIQKYRTNKTHKLFKNYILKADTSPKKIHFKKLILAAGICLLSIAVLSQFWFKQEASALLEETAVSLEAFS